MRFNKRDSEIPQVCLDLGFDKERSPGMYNPELDLTLFVNEPSAGKKRYVLQDCDDGTLGEAETDRELCELVVVACSGHDAMLREVSGKVIRRVKEK